MTGQGYGLSQRERGVFRSLQKKHQGRHVVSASFLRQDVVLESNKRQYQATFLQEAGKADLPESRLARTDKFTAIRLGMFLLAEKDIKPGSGVLQSYPNAEVFGGGVVEDLETIYNGSIDLRINNAIVAEVFPSRRFRAIGDVLQTDTIPNSSQNQFNGMVDLPQNVTLDGNDKNFVELTIPSYSGINLISSTAGQTFKLVFIMEGFLISGASSIRS